VTVQQCSDVIEEPQEMLDFILLTLSAIIEIVRSIGCPCS